MKEANNMSNVEGFSWGNTVTTLGDPGGIVTWSIAPGGLDTEIFYSVLGLSGGADSTSIDPNGFLTIPYEEIIGDAFNQWSTHGDIEFMQIADGGGDAGVGKEADIRIFFGPSPGNSLGLAFYPTGPSNPAAGDIILENSTSFNSDPQKFATVALHEIGHALGLDHEDSGIPTVMTSILSANTLQPFDIQGIQEIYGPQTNAAPVYNFDVNRTNLTILQSPENIIINANDNNNRILGSDSAEVMNGGLGFDTLLGGLGNDTLNGGDLADSLRGGEGNDVLVGGAGSDSLYGDAGNDQIWAGSGDAGNDRLFGGSGNDTLGGGAGNDTSFGGDGADVLFGGPGNDELFGEAGSDVIWAGTGNDLIYGGTENDTLGGGQGADSIFAGAGDDVVYGSTEADVVHGEAGNDTLFGGAGNDTLFGGAGDDELYSGAGTDVFVFAAGHGNDSIGGFETNGDNTIDVSALGLSGFSDLSLSQEADGVVVQPGAGSITFWGTALAEITADDFIF